MPESPTDRSYRLIADAPYVHNAYHLARVAETVYSDEPAREHAALGDSFEKVITFRATRVFGLVAGNEHHAVLAFRGSAEDREWVRGLSYGQIGQGAGRVHRGLYETLDTVWRDMLAAFYDVDVHRKTLWITGHSLGGSLAVLAAHRMREEGFSVHGVYTYGSPRVLDKNAVSAFESPLYCFVNNEDIVPDLPWPSLTDTYEHAGKRVLLLASGKIAEDRHSAGLARRIDRTETIGQPAPTSGMFHDHRIESYVAKLENHATRASGPAPVYPLH